MKAKIIHHKRGWYTVAIKKHWYGPYCVALDEYDDELYFGTSIAAIEYCNRRQIIDIKYVEEKIS